MARRHGKTVDYKQWDGLPAISLLLVANATVQGAALSFTSPATILRCRGQMVAFMDEGQQVGDKARIAVGLGIISTDAFNGGTVPDPASEAEYPWLYWHDFQLGSSLAVGINNEGSSSYRFEVDTKAMRKIRPGESLCWQAQYVDGTGTPAVDLQMAQTRVLIGT